MRSQKLIRRRMYLIIKYIISHDESWTICVSSCIILHVSPCRCVHMLYGYKMEAKLEVRDETVHWTHHWYTHTSQNKSSKHVQNLYLSKNRSQTPSWRCFCSPQTVSCLWLRFFKRRTSVKMLKRRERSCWITFGSSMQGTTTLPPRAIYCWARDAGSCITSQHGTIAYITTFSVAVIAFTVCKTT